MAEEQPEDHKWRTKLNIRLGGQVVEERLKCILPKEFKEKILRTASTSPGFPSLSSSAAQSFEASASGTPGPRFKLRLGSSGPESGSKLYKRWPKVPGVSFPGRDTPVSIVIKLEVPEGYEQDLEEGFESTVEDSLGMEEDSPAGDGATGADDDSEDEPIPVPAHRKKLSELDRLTAGPVADSRERQRKEESAAQAADRKAEQLRRRKEMANRDREEKTASTIEKILNQEGQMKKREENKVKRKREQESGDSISRGELKVPHIRTVVKQQSSTLSFTTLDNAEEWLKGKAQQGQRENAEYSEPPVALSFPWWACG